MTEIVPLKKGDVLVPLKDSAWSAYKEARVIAVETIRGVEQAWVDTIPAYGGISTLNVLSVNTLRRGWERKPTFFQVGKEYVWQRVYVNAETYKIMDIYQIENPATHDGHLSAFAIVTDAYGKQFGSSLTVGDFRRMKLK